MVALYLAYRSVTSLPCHSTPEQCRTLILSEYMLTRIRWILARNETSV